MSTKSSKSERQKRNKQKKQELKLKRYLAQRRRAGLDPDQQEARIAPLWRRFFQFLIDQVLLGLLAIVFMAIFSIVIPLNQFPPILAVLPVLIYGFGYYIPAVSKRGQSFGMRKLKVMILDSKGERFPSYLSSAIRFFVLFIIPNSVSVLAQSPDSLEEQMALGIVSFALTTIVLLPIIFTKNNLGFHDLFSKVLVIEVPAEEPQV